jgi:hypothetical protein
MFKSEIDDSNGGRAIAKLILDEMLYNTVDMEPEEPLHDIIGMYERTKG